MLNLKNRKKEVVPDLVREGFEVCDRLLNMSYDDENREEVHQKLCDINRRICNEIYAYNRASISVKDSINGYCKYIIVFQIINYLTRPEADEASVRRACRGYNIFYDQFLNRKPGKDYSVLRFRVRALDKRNFRLRFALRQAIVIMPCLAFAYITKLPNIYWLPISVFFMMIPFSDQTLQRVKQRVLGTVGGICICMILFTIFKSFTARVVIMTIANFMIYGAGSYGATVAYITCSALALQSIDAVVPIVLGQRLMYTLIGAVIALLANRFIFPVRSTKQIDYLVELLADIRQKISNLYADETVSVRDRRKQTDQYIVKSYLLTERIKALASQSQFEDYDIDQVKKVHIFELADFMPRHMIDLIL